ncbi:MAG: 3-deoxy-7-phosphoheptulonate synthase [Candidatus Marinimicrobia bacterium]|nr:3-deoxy-7-phosphoheptulonate synthase [Candidatus Neomarinimicrobiota bacterium]MCF7828338.1 3-deoxy-7-phosphoheptulonate synthase [Candidatus Neomarinimicrobiota bacterium]MCF7879487.1 3-deoxy-7-phosphoheptulonate synthase [Candidatus Neomarinimicrobiota bacterium]
MIIVMKPDAEEQDLNHVTESIEDAGFKVHLSQGTERTIVGVIGDERSLDKKHYESFPGVEEIVPILKPYKLSSKDFHPEGTVVNVNDVSVGTDEVVVIAGPCSVEGWDQLRTTANEVKNAGAKILRGGAFKPRTSPYSFQGLGEEGLEMLDTVGDETGMPVITEVMGPSQVELVAKYSDILQIGARNMQNYNLLHAAGESDTPVMLKRGFSNTIDELLLAAEYIMSNGNYNVMLCERGIRTFDSKYTRNTLDINAVPVLKELSHLPVIVDPSHATGKWELVQAASRAAVAAGADGLIIEVHPNPTEALSDGRQSLVPDRFSTLMGQINHIAHAIDRHVSVPEQEPAAV